jgi:hypothetical protein
MYSKLRNIVSTESPITVNSIELFVPKFVALIVHACDLQIKYITCIYNITTIQTLLFTVETQTLLLFAKVK